MKAAALVRVILTMLIALAGAIAALPIHAQTPVAENFILAAGPIGQNMVQAGDGNFYFTTIPAFESCPTDSTMECAFIYKMTPSGTVTQFHAFQPVPVSALPVNADGIQPRALIVGTDGNLYGACQMGGPGGFGTIFKLTLNNQITLLASFTVNTTNGNSYGYMPVSLVEGSDGNFYFNNGIGIFMVPAAGGTVTTVHPYALSPANSNALPEGGSATSLLEASDGFLYITQSVSPRLPSGQTGYNAGAISRVSLTGQFNIVYTLNADGSDGNQPLGPLVQGADGSFYGTTKFSGNTTNPGKLFKVTSGGSYTVLHAFGGTSDGNRPNQPILGGDGNFYGTTLTGGDTASANCTPIGCGSLFRMTPAGSFTTLYNYEGGGPTITNPSAPIDGASPNSPLQINGNDFVTTGFGNAKSIPAVFSTTVFGTGLPSPIELAVTPTQVGIGQKATLTWKAVNVFSKTAQQCGAYLQGGSGGGNWSGKQTGTYSNGVLSGTASITPTKAGAYTYALTCGGRQSGYVTLNVLAGFQITSVALPQGEVNAAYTAPLTASGGVEPYTWSVDSLPLGLSLNSTTGVISGKPQQFGDYTLNVTVTDSANPKNQLTAAVTLKIISGLKIATPSLPKATIGATYPIKLGAQYGLPPYFWSVLSGTLPNGLTLSSGGILTGIPTATGKYTFTVQVKDSEGTPATDQLQYVLKVYPDIQIAAVEFSQAIQQYQTLDDLETMLTASGEPPVPIVSGKPAVMRLYFSRVKDSTDITVKATGAVVGTKPFTVQPNCAPERQRADELMCRSMDFYFIAPPGTWTANLELDDSNDNQLETETLTVSSRDTSSILMKAASVCSRLNDPRSCQDPTGLFQLTWFAGKILPTNSVLPTVTTRLVYMDYSDTTDYPTAQDWEGAVIDYMQANYYTATDASADSTQNQWTDYVGIYSNILDDTGIGLLGKHALAIPNQANRQGVDGTAQILAHETGHTLNLPHTGNGAPSGSSVGTCWGPGEVDKDDPNKWIYTTNHLVSGNGNAEWGFDVLGGQPIPGDEYFDVMAYCMNRWISPYNYKNMLTFLNGGAVLSPNAKKGRARAALKPRRMVTYAQGSYMQISGSIPSTGLVLNPIFTQTQVGTSDTGAGAYSIQVLGSAGQVLFTRHFDITAGRTDTTGTDFHTPPLFSEFIPVIAGMSSIAVLDPTGATLGTVKITGAAPTITVTNPTAGVAASGLQIVNWTINSPSASNFTSRVYYSTDGGTTWEDILETVSTTATIDFDRMPGSSAARIRVDVSDGVNTGSESSALFSVPKKTPSTVLITSPANGAAFQAANPVFLTGAAYDVDDGILTGKALQWSDNVQGVLGTGTSFTATLSPGSHTITLTATDSDGNSMTATTTITLGGAPPVVALTSNQSGGCTGVTINATPGNQGAALSSVNLSLDGGNTYTPIPLASLPFSQFITGSGTMELVVAAADASGQVSSQSSEIAGCAATTLKANGGGGQRTLVGSAFTTALSALVTDVNGNPVPGATVNFSAPASGASASLSAASATTNASGIATIIATANNIAGDYNITASAANAPATVNFALTNSDYQIGAASSALTIARGASGTDVITLTALGGFNGAVNFTCSGAPSGAACTFSPATVTLTSATATTTMTITASQTAAVRWPAGGAGILACTAFAFLFRRRKYFVGFGIVLALIATFTLAGCGGGLSKRSPTQGTITVTAASRGVQHTTTVSVQIE